MTIPKTQTPPIEPFTELAILTDEAFASLPDRFHSRSEQPVYYFYKDSLDKIGALRPELPVVYPGVLAGERRRLEELTYQTKSLTIFGRWLRAQRVKKNLAPAPEADRDPEYSVEITEPFVSRRQGLRFKSRTAMAGYVMTKTSFSGKFVIQGREFELDIDEPVIDLGKITYEPHTFKDSIYPEPQERFTVVPSLGHVTNLTDRIDDFPNSYITDGAKKEHTLDTIRSILNEIQNVSDPQLW